MFLLLFVGFTVNFHLVIHISYEEHWVCYKEGRFRRVLVISRVLHFAWRRYKCLVFQCLTCDLKVIYDTRAMLNIGRNTMQLSIPGVCEHERLHMLKACVTWKVEELWLKLRIQWNAGLERKKVLSYLYVSTPLNQTGPLISGEYTCGRLRYRQRWNQLRDMH